MPCWERFEEQEAEYRDSVLPPTVAARVSVEAGSTIGWERFVGDRGASVGIDRFGASAPAERVFRELGITPEAVRDRAKTVLAAIRGGVRA
jgi:transketolase